MINIPVLSNSWGSWVLAPRILPTTPGGACGIGGESQFVKTAEIPTALQGKCGTLKLNVLKGAIPLLLPVSFSRGLGMVLDMPQKKIHWEYLKISQEFEELPSGHIAINIFEFPPSGWKSPHTSPGPAIGNAVDPSVKDESFQTEAKKAELAASRPKISNPVRQSPSLGPGCADV